MSFAMPAKQVTVVYVDEYVSAANVIEARIQAFTGYKSRLWDVSFYESNKGTLDSDHLVLFLGGFEENVAAKTYEKVFEVTEKACGCVYSIAGSKALIYPTGDASHNALRLDGTTYFYSDSEGNTRAKESFTDFQYGATRRNWGWVWSVNGWLIGCCRIHQCLAKRNWRRGVRNSCKSDLLLGWVINPLNRVTAQVNNESLSDCR